jgi:predicted Zn-dependent peptidase
VPEEASLRAFTSDDLHTFHRQHYLPNNALLVAFGDISLSQLLPKLERTLGGWEKGSAAPTSLPPLKSPDRARVYLIDRPGSVQTSLLLGGLGIERKHADYFPALVMNHILGGSPASRLFVNLREDKGYTYGVSSSFNGSKFPGVMVTNTDVRTTVTEGALQELVGEITRIGTQAVSATELANAKRALVGRYALSLDNPQSLMVNLIAQKIYGLPADYWDKYPQNVEAITAQDVRRVALKYYNPERLQIVAVGDAASVRKTLEKYGSVESGEGAVQSTP